MKYHLKARFGNLGFLVLLLSSFFIATGCSSVNVKKYQVEIRVPMTSKIAPPSRIRLVLRAADSLKDPNLSRTEEYVLTEKNTLSTTLIKAAANRMTAIGIEPLEDKEAHLSSGRVLFVITRLEAVLVKQNWLASTELRAERYSKEGKLLGKWSAIGRSSYQNSRLFAGGAGIAMGNAMSKALGKLPWRAIALGRQKPPGK